VNFHQRKLENVLIGFEYKIKQAAILCIIYRLVATMSHLAVPSEVASFSRDAPSPLSRINVQ